MATLTDKVNQIYDENLEFQKTQMQKDFQAADANFTQQEALAKQAAENAITRAQVESALSGADRDSRDLGLTSGAMAQLQFSQDNQLRADVGTIQEQQKLITEEINRQRALLSKKYESDIRKAQADNDMGRAKMLYEAAKEEEARLEAQQRAAAAAAARAAKAELAIQKEAAQVMIDEAGDYTRYGLLNGLTQDEIDRLNGKKSAPVPALPNVSNTDPSVKDPEYAVTFGNSLHKESEHDAVMRAQYGSYKQYVVRMIAESGLSDAQKQYLLSKYNITSGDLAQKDGYTTGLERMLGVTGDTVNHYGTQVQTTMQRIGNWAGGDKMAYKSPEEGEALLKELQNLIALADGVSTYLQNNKEYIENYDTVYQNHVANTELLKQYQGSLQESIDFYKLFLPTEEQKQQGYTAEQIFTETCVYPQRYEGYDLAKIKTAIANFDKLIEDANNGGRDATAYTKERDWLIMHAEEVTDSQIQDLVKTGEDFLFYENQHKAIENGLATAFKPGYIPYEEGTAEYWQAYQAQEKEWKQFINRKYEEYVRKYGSVDAIKQRVDSLSGEDKRTWFQKGAYGEIDWKNKGVFENIGLMMKGAAATNADILENISTAAMEFAEKAVDALAIVSQYAAQGQYYQNGGAFQPIAQQQAAEASFDAGKQWAEGFVKKDIIKGEQWAKAPIAATGFDVEGNSVLGEKSDALIQSGAEVAGTVALQAAGVPWFVTSAVSAFGGETENALNEGATIDEAALSGLITAGAEVLTEKLAGITYHGKPLTEGFTNFLTKGISNKFVKKLAQFGLDSVVFGEGTEEVVTELIGRFGQWLTYQDDKTLQEMFASEEAADAYIESYIGGFVLGEGNNTINHVITANAGKKMLDAGITPEQLIEIGKTGETDGDAQKAADELQKMIESGEKISNYDIGKLVQAIKAEGLLKELQTNTKSNTPHPSPSVTPSPQGEGLGGTDSLTARQSRSAQNDTVGTNNAYEDALALANNADKGTLDFAVAMYRQSGSVSNAQATRILNDPQAVEALKAQTGMELPGTASGNRAAVKSAIAVLAQQQAATEAQTADGNTDGSLPAESQTGADIFQEVSAMARGEEIAVQKKQQNIDNASNIAYNNIINGGEQNERAASAGADQGGVSGVYEGRRDDDGRRTESNGASINSGLILLNPSSINLLNQRGVVYVELYECSADNAAFSVALDNARKADKINGWAVTFKTNEELDSNNIRTFMDGNASTGFAIAPDGDVEAVFANKAAGAPKGSTKVTIPLAIANGGTKLDCYGIGLVRLYAKYGFIPVARTTFDPTQANDGWTPDKGTPDIYFLMHNGDNADVVVQNYGNYHIPTPQELDALPLMEYEAAYDYRDALLAQREKNNVNPGDSTGDNPSVGADESVGAAPAGFDMTSHLKYEHGTIPEGENPVRPDDLPKKDIHGKDVSYTARTVKGAEVTPDDFVDLLDKDAVEGGLSYVKITNDATVQKAIDYITNEGWVEAKAKWHADVQNRKTGADLVATGALLLNNAAKAGDKAAWLDILHDYQILGTNTAQSLQALRILKQLAPSDKLYMARRSIKQMVEDMKLDTEVTIDPELETEYLNAETDQQRDAVLKKIQKNVARQLPTTFMEKFTALRYVNMLGNLRTQGRNIVGNLTMMGTRAIHNAVATGIETVANKVSGGKVERTRSVILNNDQLRACVKDFDTVQEQLLEGGKFNDNDTATGFARGVQNEKQIFKFKPLEGYRKLTNWAMEQGDIIFAKDAYARALAGYLKAKGITETDLSKIDSTVMDDARLFAIKEAQEATFRDTNWLSGWVSKIGRRKDTPTVGKMISEGVMPFRKTPANVLVRAEEYSPLGVINSVVMSVKAAQKGSDITANQVINSWAKTLTGTGLFGLGVLLQILGLLSAGPDEDENKDDFEDLNGWQDYAITLPDGTNLTIDCFSPSAIPILMGAQLMKETNRNGFQLKDIGDALLSIADPLVEMSMLQGVNDTLENIQYADSSLGQLVINAAVGYLTQGLTNTLAGQIERSFEDSRMQTFVDKDSNLPDWLQRTLGKASAKIPGWDYNQIPYINAWGEEEKNPSTGLNLVYNLLSPVYFDKGRDDDLTRELNRLNDAQGDINVYPSIPDKTVTWDKKEYHLSKDEYVSLAKKQGQAQKKLVEDLIANSDYDFLSDKDKAKAIRYAYDYARDSARGEVIEEHPGITTKWMAKIKGDVADAIVRHVATGTTDKYLDLSVQDAAYVVDIFNMIQPESAKGDVRTIQKIEAVADADGALTESEQRTVMKDVLDEDAYKKFQNILALGYGMDGYAASYRIYLDEKEEGGKGTKDRIIKAFSQEFNISKNAATKLYECYVPPKKK